MDAGRRGRMTAASGFAAFLDYPSFDMCSIHSRAQGTVNCSEVQFIVLSSSWIMWRQYIIYVEFSLAQPCSSQNTHSDQRMPAVPKVAQRSLPGGILHANELFGFNDAPRFVGNPDLCPIINGRARVDPNVQINVGK